jgi:hypothetical protein
MQLSPTCVDTRATTTGPLVTCPLLSPLAHYPRAKCWTTFVQSRRTGNSADHRAASTPSRFQRVHKQVQPIKVILQLRHFDISNPTVSMALSPAPFPFRSTGKMRGRFVAAFVRCRLGHLFGWLFVAR